MRVQHDVFTGATNNIGAHTHHVVGVEVLDPK